MGSTASRNDLSIVLWRSSSACRAAAAGAAASGSTLETCRAIVEESTSRSWRSPIVVWSRCERFELPWRDSARHGPERLHQVAELLQLDPHAVDGLEPGGVDGQAGFSEAGEPLSHRLKRGAPDRRRGPRTAEGALQDAPDVAPQTTHPAQPAVELTGALLVLRPGASPAARRARARPRPSPPWAASRARPPTSRRSPDRSSTASTRRLRRRLPLRGDEGREGLQRGQEPARRRAEVVDDVVDPSAAPDRDAPPDAPSEPAGAVLDRRREGLREGRRLPARGRRAPSARGGRTRPAPLAVRGRTLRRERETATRASYGSPGPGARW